MLKYKIRFSILNTLINNIYIYIYIIVLNYLFYILKSELFNEILPLFVYVICNILNSLYIDTK